jgi:hypothetical protein
MLKSLTPGFESHVEDCSRERQEKHKKGVHDD